MINLADKPLIKGEKVILRPFTDEDLPFIEECVKDPEVLKMTGSSSDFDREKFSQWYSTRNNQCDRLDLAIVDKFEDSLVGEVVINSYNKENHSMNFRILIGPKGRDKGLGTEAVGLIIEYMFTETTLSELTLSVFDFNPKAKHVYEKAGFITTSIDENDLEFEGRWIDSINMKLTRDSWSLRKFR